MRNYLQHELEYIDGPIKKLNIELSTRFYSGGTSSGSTQSSQSSQATGGGLSTSTGQAQLNPSQVLTMYGQALPSILNTTNTGVANSAAAPALNAATQGAVAGVNAINLNGLSPGESNAVERSTNQANQQSGNLGVINPTNTVANALNFGGAFNSKIGLLNTATNTATGAANAANNTTSTVSSLFNPIASNANTTVSNSNSVFGNQSSSQGSGSGNQSSLNVGCFLTTACCEYKGLPDNCEELTVLRNFRDTYVPRDMVEEYYHIAPNIVVRITGNKEALEYVWRTVKQCVDDIRNNRHECALNRYKLMVNTLKN